MTKTNFGTEEEKGGRWVGRAQARCSDGQPQALAFVRRQKTLCWSKHHLSQTFRFQDCFTHSKTFCLVLLGTFKSTLKLILNCLPPVSLMRWLQLVHAEARVSPGLEVQVYIFSQPYFDFPASSQYDIDTAHIYEIDIAQIPGY